MAPSPPSLEALARGLSHHLPNKQEQTPRRVRAIYDTLFLFDTISAVYVWEHPYYPQYYVPASEFSAGLLIKRDAVEGTDNGVFWATVKGRKKETDRVLWFEHGSLKGLIRVEFGAVDQWFEEDQPIYVHPKDPYKRVDVLPSARKITVKVDGVVVAESSNNMFLFETGLRPRYYLPKTSVQWQYLIESSTITKCPYKGEAYYYHVFVNGTKHEDLIWWYPHTTAESGLVAGMVCFYNEKVEIYIDGVKEK